MRGTMGGFVCGLWCVVCGVWCVWGVFIIDALNGGAMGGLVCGVCGVYSLLMP